jgi:hypothetical protein
VTVTIDGEQLLITHSDLSTLRRAAYLHRAFDCGIGPRRGGQFAHYRKMERIGLLAFDGWGRDIDGECERDVLVYQLTDKGRSVLAATGDG